MAQQARAVLAKAEAEVAEQKAAQPKPLPPGPPLTEWVAFLGEPAAARAWLVLMLLGAATAVLSHWLAMAAGGGLFAQFGALFLSIFVLAAGLTWLLTASACCQVVVQDTANGRDKIQNWPGPHIFEWAWDALFVTNSALAAFLPGLILGLAVPWMGVVVGLLGCAVFPLFLLSALENESRLVVYSPIVWRRLQAAPQLWRRFYLQSGVAMIGMFVGASCLIWGGFLLQLFGSAVFTTAWLVYSRLLGRLSRQLSELPAAAE